MITEYKTLKHTPEYSGDCGLCVIGGITGISKSELIEKYNGRGNGMDYEDLYKVCWMLFSDKKLNWIYNDLPRDVRYMSASGADFGHPSWTNFISWSEQAKRMLNAGCLGIAKVNMSGNAMGDRTHQFVTDHWVMIRGINYGKDGDVEYEGKSRVVHISCSVRGEYSVNCFEFLLNYGGYNTIWIRPTNKT